MFFKKTSPLLVALTLANCAFADNPLVTHMYTADPTARVMNGKLYVFPSSDIPATDPASDFNGFTMPGYNVFSSTNLVQWDDSGRVLSQADVTWASQEALAMWAPDCIEKDGTYYLYFPTRRATDNGFNVGLATASQPEGPYTLEASFIAGANGIDPNAFIDDDDQAYLYWGGGTNTDSLKVAKLSSDMKSLDGATTSIVTANLPAGYREGPFMFKRGDTYYFTFPLDAEGDGIGGEALAYATGSSPMGPFTYQGQIMDAWPDCWTNHHSIVEYEGQWYLFYHYQQISGIAQQRSMRAEPITFNVDGTIQHVTPTLRGIGTCPSNAKIQIDRNSDTSSGIQVERTNAVTALPAQWNLGYIQNGSWARYDRVDFGTGTQTSATVSCSSGSSGGTVELRVGSETGTLIASIPVTATSGWSDYQEFTGPVIHAPQGVQDLVAVFTGGSGYLLNIDWVSFTSESVIIDENFFEYDNGTVLGPDTGWNVSTNPSNDLLTTSSGVVTFDLSQALRNYSAVYSTGLQMGQGRIATLSSEFRYYHNAGGDSPNFDGSAFGLLVSPDTAASGGGKSSLALANRGSKLGNRLPVSPWTEDGPTHASLGVDTTAGGYSDWLRLEWVLTDTGSAIETVGYIYRVSDNTLLHTTTPFDCSIASGGTFYPGFSTGWNNVGPDATIESFTKFNKVQFDNFKLTLEEPAGASILIFK